MGLGSLVERGYLLLFFSSDQAAEDSLSPGIIAGITVACSIIAMCITIVLSLICYRHRPSSPKSKHWSPPTLHAAVTCKSE